MFSGHRPTLDIEGKTGMRKFTEKSRGIKKIIAAQSILLLFCAGCGGQTVEEPLVIVDSEDETVNYSMVACEREDVVLISYVSCEYVQAAQQEVMLESGGRQIERVCVREGDRVKTGDVLLQLAENNLEERIENLSYQISMNELMLSSLEEQEKLSLDETYYSFVYGSGLETEEELEEYEKRVEEVKKGYRYQKEDYRDALEFDRQELSKLETELEQSRVYARIDGMVYKIEDGLEGSTTRKDQVIMTVVDESEGYFVAEDKEAFADAGDDAVYMMRVSYGDGAGDYELIPSQMDSWGEKQYLEILSGPEEGILSVGTKGTIEVTLEKRSGVLSLPNSCVYTAGEERYVYVPDEYGMKTVRYVKTGLEGNNRTEILEGISEGEMVVKK